MKKPKKKPIDKQLVSFRRWGKFHTLNGMFFDPYIKYLSEICRDPYEEELYKLIKKEPKLPK